MPNKKNKKSANRKLKEVQGFGVYLHDRVREYRRRGLPMSVVDIVSTCRAEWKNMSVDDQAKYNNRAKAIKRQLLADDRLKSDSFGRNVAEVKAEERKKMEDLHRKRQKTKEMVDAAVVVGRLPLKSFVLVHFNLFCSTTDVPPRHYPCEVGAVRFSFEKGIDAYYHSFIDPGELPFGYHLDMLKISEESHQLKPEMVKDMTSFEGIKLNLQRLIRTADGVYDPVFVLPEHVAIATDCLEFVFKRSLPFHNEKSHFDVIDVTELLLQLLEQGPKQVGSNDSWQYGRGMVHDMLISSKYDYACGTSCGFHELMDNQLHCALGNVMHRAIIICNKFCPLFHIELKSGRHLPPIIPPAEVKKAQEAWERRGAQQKKGIPAFAQPSYGLGPTPSAASSAEASCLHDFDTDAFLSEDSSAYMYFGADEGDDAYEDLEDDMGLFPGVKAPIASGGSRVQEANSWNAVDCSRGDLEETEDDGGGWSTVGAPKNSRSRKPPGDWISDVRRALPR